MNTHFTAEMTDEHGIMNHNDRRGPFVFEDDYKVKKAVRYGREHISEQVIRENGFVARGVFKVENSMEAYTSASFLQKKEDETTVLAHFSTGIHTNDSPETLRKPHGFTVDFFSAEGIYHYDGNNVPISFVRNGIGTDNLEEGIDIEKKTKYWEYMSQNPETTNMLIHLYTDEGIPASYRTMSGSSVQTYRWINEAGEETYVKLRWIPKQGIVNLNVEEAIKVQAVDDHHATHDIYMAIERGDFPEWDLYVQLLNPQQMDNLDYDPLDATKDWLESDVPYQKVGTMTLNHNINYEHGEIGSYLEGKNDLAQGIAYDVKASEKHDDFSQAGNIYRNYREDVKKSLIHNLLIELNAVKETREDIVNRVIHNFYQADENLGQSLAEGCGIALSDCLH